MLIVFLKCWSYISFHRSSTINAFPTLKDKLSFHKSSSICHTRCFFLNWPCPENGRITVMKVTVWVQTLLLFVFSLFWKEFCYLQHFLGRGLIALLNWLLLLGFVFHDKYQWEIWKKTAAKWQKGLYHSALYAISQQAIHCFIIQQLCVRGVCR